MSACQKFVGQVTRGRSRVMHTVWVCTHTGRQPLSECVDTVVVLQLSLLLLLFAHSLVNVLVAVVFFFFLSAVRACTPVIVCSLCSQSHSRCRRCPRYASNSWRSLRWPPSCARALTAAALSHSTLAESGASKQFEIYIHYLLLLFESKRNHD